MRLICTLHPIPYLQPDWPIYSLSPFFRRRICIKAPLAEPKKKKRNHDGIHAPAPVDRAQMVDVAGFLVVAKEKHVLLGMSMLVYLGVSDVSGDLTTLTPIPPDPRLGPLTSPSSARPPLHATF